MIYACEVVKLWALALVILKEMPKRTVASFGSAISACEKVVGSEGLTLKEVYPFKA